MRLRIEEDVFVGTPVQIVESLRLRDASDPRTVDEYMLRFLERAATYRRFAITGATVENRCARFLTGLIRNLDAEIA
jgi:hypothetical protein